MTIRLRTAAWYGDRELELGLPEGWEVETLWPRTPPPLHRDALAAALEQPVGQPPLRTLARGRRRPVIVCDDLTRPTPADQVLPLVLRQLAEAGIAGEDVTIVVGGGSHQPAGPGQLARKVGIEVATRCRIVAHDCHGDVARVGRTSFGTPVLVNRHVADADLVVGVGGVYPQHSVGFGGGAKLALGVLGWRSIVALHYGHSSVAGTHDIENDFRRDLDEVAELIGLRTMALVNVDADRQIVRAAAGDQRALYAEAAAFARDAYSARTPGDADVVVVNGYPMDVSLTFTRSKGMAPLFQAAPDASRVLVAACPEGLGLHGLFPYLNGPRFEHQRHQFRRLSVVRPGSVPGKLARRAQRLVARASRPAPSAAAPPPPARRPFANPIWFYVPHGRPGQLPDETPGLRQQFQWADVMDHLRAEQAGKKTVRVLVYPCAALQCLEWQGGERTGHLTEQVG